jgi:glycosyltransferase involved in cell wall biosynthesis
MYIGFYTKGLLIDPTIPLEEQSLGGSESSLYYLSCELSKMGHHVDVFCNTVKSVESGNLNWYPFIDILHRVQSDKSFDAFVSHRYHGDLLQLSSLIKTKMYILWNHDMPHPDLIENLSYFVRADKIIFLSEFHKQAYRDLVNVDGSDINGQALDDISIIGRNGIDFNLINQFKKNRVIFSNRFIYGSRPERGLRILLQRIWKLILKKYPDAELYVTTYDYDHRYVSNHSRETYRQVYTAMSNIPNIIIKEKLTKRDWYELLSSSNMMLYPCTFPEISCINAIEAQALGVPIVTTDDFALSETVGSSYCRIKEDPYSQEYVEDFVKRTIALKEDKKMRDYVVKTNMDHIDVKYDWNYIAQEWLDIINEFIDTHYEKRDKTVSLCMITKDSERDILKAIDSVKNVVDEVCVYDTGSTDRTLSLIQESSFPVPVKIEKGSWTDSFEDARNKSIEKASSDWILWMDSDEFLMNPQLLRQYLNTRYFNGYLIAQRHIMFNREDPDDLPMRLFRNDDRFRFYGVIHEQPMINSNSPIYPAYIIPDLVFMHSGYMTEALRRHKAMTRNFPLLIKDRQLYPERDLGVVFLMRDMYHIAIWEIESLRGSISVKSYNLFQQIIRIFRNQFFQNPKDPIYPYAFRVYQLVLRAMLELGIWIEDSQMLPIKLTYGIHADLGGNLRQDIRSAERLVWIGFKDEMERLFQVATDDIFNDIDKDHEKLIEPVMLIKESPIYNDFNISEEMLKLNNNCDIIEGNDVHTKQKFNTQS